MIQQHFIRSPTVRQKLEDRYAGVELCSGILIAAAIILILLFITSTEGALFFLLMLACLAAVIVSLGLAVWAVDKKKKVRSSAISGPLSDDQMNVMGIYYRPILPITTPRSTIFEVRQQQHPMQHPNHDQRPPPHPNKVMMNGQRIETVTVTRQHQLDLLQEKFRQPPTVVVDGHPRYNPVGSQHQRF